MPAERPIDIDINVISSCSTKLNEKYENSIPPLIVSKLQNSRIQLPENLRPNLLGTNSRLNSEVETNNVSYDSKVIHPETPKSTYYNKPVTYESNKAFGILCLIIGVPCLMLIANVQSSSSIEPHEAALVYGGLGLITLVDLFYVSKYFQGCYS